MVAGCAAVREADQVTPALVRKLVDGAWRWVQESDPADGGSQPLLVATKQLIDAEIKALPETPIEVIPTPGPNKMIVPVSAVLVCDGVEGDYTGISADSFIALASEQGAQATAVLSWIDEAIGGVTSLIGFGAENGQPVVATLTTRQKTDATKTDTFANSVIGFTTNLEDLPLLIWAQNGESGDTHYADGDPANTLTVTVFYTVVDL